MHAVALLVAAQVLAQTAAITLVATSSLIGFDLAADKSLATLPLALGMISGAALTLPAARLMQRRGRRAGFLAGAFCGLACALLAVLALRWHSLPLFVLASMLGGAYQACFQFYRFAATEAVDASRRPRVLSLVVSAGIVAALAGPALASLATSGNAHAFEYAYLLLAALAAVALLLLWRLRLPAPQPRAAGAAPPRPVRELVAQPVFVTALTASAVGVGVMSMIMSATPLAMQLCGLPRSESPQVIRWHMLGMFVPSLFSGDLIRRLGVYPVLLLGTAMLALQWLVSSSGVTLAHFTAGLLLLGIGWNFLYVGGSTLLARAWRPGEEGTVQAMHDAVVYVLASAASWTAGALLTAAGWKAVNLLALPALAAVSLVVVAQWRRAGASVIGGAR